MDRVAPILGVTDVQRTVAYVHVGDADRLLAEFRAAGVTVFRDICDEEYGLRDFCIETPDGHRVAFGAPLA